MSPRVFMAALAQETNVFSPLPTGLQSFSGRFQLAGSHSCSEPPFPEALRHALEKRAAAGHLQWVEGLVAGAHPGGTVTRHAYGSLRDQILAQLAAARDIDIVALHLHLAVCNSTCGSTAIATSGGHAGRSTPHRPVPGGWQPGHAVSDWRFPCLSSLYRAATCCVPA
jgi:hypothetical protein